MQQELLQDLEGGGTPLLIGNARWFGPGGESILQEAGEDIIVFHAYDGGTGRPYLQISSIAWVNDWPEAASNGVDAANK